MTSNCQFFGLRPWFLQVSHDLTQNVQPHISNGITRLPNTLTQNTSYNKFKKILRATNLIIWYFDVPVKITEFWVVKLIEIHIWPKLVHWRLPRGITHLFVTFSIDMLYRGHPRLQSVKKNHSITVKITESRAVKVNVNRLLVYVWTSGFTEKLLLDMSEPPCKFKLLVLLYGTVQNCKTILSWYSTTILYTYLTLPVGNLWLQQSRDRMKPIHCRHKDDQPPTQNSHHAQTAKQNKEPQIHDFL